LTETIDYKINLSQYFNENLSFNTSYWLQFLQEKKGYLITLLKENGILEDLEEFGNPIMNIVAKNILEINQKNITDLAQIRGIKDAKLEFPIHLAWELFQSTRGIVWNTLRTFHLESQISLSMDKYFMLERQINNIIDLFIESYTASYVKYKDDLLKSHREIVEELSVPIIPLVQKVCILPIVGNIDSYRAKKIREKTLQRVSDLKVKQLIIDISGVPYVDTTVVNHIFKIVKGIKLLGCSTILTGISPKIADTMIELGVEINNELKTESDLQQALQSIHVFS
jgi:rsbT co-antagonist protein RsbR